MTESKEKYETPVLTTIGSFEDVTQANVTGSKTDAALGAGVPVAGHLTS
jgi:hypothetical protein